MDSMEGVKGVYSAETTSTQELDGDTVEATVKAVFPAEFTTAVGETSPAFRSNKFIKEHLPFLPE